MQPIMINIKDAGKPDLRNIEQLSDIRIKRIEDELYLTAECPDCEGESTYPYDYGGGRVKMIPCTTCKAGRVTLQTKDLTEIIYQFWKLRFK